MPGRARATSGLTLRLNLTVARKVTLLHLILVKASSSRTMAVLPRSSYYDKHYKQSEALIRARRPYLVRNAVTGACIFAFAIGVYAFTIKAVAQDNFEDVKVPDAPTQASRAEATTVTNGPVFR